MRKLAFVLTAFAALVAFAPPASAGTMSPYTDTDPAGDTAYDRGDIDRIKLVYVDSGQVHLDVGTQAPTTANSPVWNDPAGRTTLRWTIYTPGMDDHRQVRLRGTAGGPVARMVTLDGDPVACAVSVAFVSARRIRLSFSDACLGTAAAIRNIVSYKFTPGGGASSTDRWPDGVASEPIFPECPPPPSGAEGC